MATIKELVTRFGFEIDDKGLQQLEGGISAARDGLLGLGSVMTGAAVTLFGLVQHAASTGNQLYVMSRQAGIGVEKLQELQFRAKLADLSTEELGQSLNFLNRNLHEARQGSAAAQKAFHFFGISTAQLKDKSFSAERAIELIGKRFKDLPNGPAKTGAAMEIFGRGGARMVGFLSELSEALTPVQQKILAMSMITAEQAKAGDDFGDALDVLLIGWKSIAKTIGFELMPVMKDIVDQATLWLVQNKNIVKTNVSAFVRGLVAAFKVALGVADTLIKSFAGFASTLGGVEDATKILIGAMVILSGASILIGVGMLTKGVLALASSLTAASIAGAAANLAIGGMFIALLLVMEDISSYFQGKDSFLGDILKALPELAAMFEATFGPIFEPLVAFITSLTDGTITWKSAFQDIGVLILNTVLSPLRLALSTIGLIISGLGRLTGSATTLGIGDAMTALAADVTARGLGEATGLSGIGPATATRSIPGGRQTTNNLQNQTVLNFPPGTDPLKVTDKISSSVGGGIEDILRMANAQTATGGAD